MSTRPRARRKTIRRVGLVTRTTSGDAIHLTRRLEAWLRRRGIEVLHDAESMGARHAMGGVPRAEISKHVDLLVTLGGDGTLLSVARRFGVTVKQLQDANKITNPDRIYPGQVITIP